MSERGKKRIKTELLVHDLKNPLAIIEAGVTPLLRREDKYGLLTEMQKKVLKRVLRNTKVAKGLVNDILEVGRSSEGVIIRGNFPISDFVKYPFMEIFDLTDYDLAESIRKCVTLVDFKEILLVKGIRLRMEERAWSQDVCLDERKMRQILRNLLNNAFKYRQGLVELTIEKEEGSLWFSVYDDGKGIEKNYHDRIFECYFQLDDDRDSCVRGHGLGLAGVLILVEDMGGKLSLESDEGKGTKFTVSIPY